MSRTNPADCCSSGDIFHVPILYVFGHGVFFVPRILSVEWFHYTADMYSIRLRANHRLDECVQGYNTHIGVRLKNGDVRFCPWGGFTLEIKQPVKLQVDSSTLDDRWDPRRTESKMPRWCELNKGEFLLGSHSDRLAYTVLPFRVVKPQG